MDAAFVAALITFLEIDKVFSIPPHADGRWPIRGLIAGFVLANAALATLLYALVNHAGTLPTLAKWQLGFIVGASYLGLVRSKFATFNGQPFGFEYLYNLGKDFAYTRVNRRVTEARSLAIKARAKEEDLPCLASSAKLAIAADSLLTEVQKKEAKEWVLRVIEDSRTTDEEKRQALADLILFGGQAGHD